MKIFQMFIFFIRMLWSNNYMIRSMVVRDLRSRYVGSLMGLFWSVIHPLTQIALYYFIFSVLFKVRLGPEYGGTSFALWMIAGLLPWMFVSEVLGKAPSAVIEQANIVKKVVFPSEIFPIVHLAAAVVNHLIALAILGIVLLVFGQGIPVQIFWLVPCLAMAGIFALGLSWILSSLNVFLRDIGHLIGVVLNIWFFLTPIVYPREVVPVSLRGFFDMNPIFHVVEGYRMAFLGKAEFDPLGYAYLIIAAIGFLIIGALTFRKLKPAFADVL